MQRHNSAAGTKSGGSDGFREVEEDGVEYLVHDVVAQREGVYTYPDPSGGVRKELAPAEELHAAIEAKESVPIVVSHPEDSEGDPAMLKEPRANGDTVGEWRDLRKTRDEDGIAGKVFIRKNEIGEHDGDLKSYVDTVRRRGLGEVSTGYDIREAEPDSGRMNGLAYDYVQRGIDLDHLALLPSEQGDCSIEDGCGLGRANEKEGTGIRVNHHHPDRDEPADDANSGFEVMAEESGSLDMLRFNAEVEYKAISLSPDDVSFTDNEWNGQAAEDGFPNPSEDDDAPEVLDQVYAAIPKGEEARDSKSNWKLPFRTGPDAPVNTRALVAIDSALSGARGGVEGISESVREDIQSWVEKMLSAAPDDLFGASEEERQNVFARAGKKVAGLFGLDTALALGETTPAESGERRANMQDKERIDELVEEHGFTRENIAPLKGTTCLSRIHEAVVEEGGESNPNMGDEGTEEGEESGEGSTLPDDFDEQVRDIVSDEVTSTLEEHGLTEESEESDEDVESGSVEGELDKDALVEEAAEMAAEKADEVRANEHNIETIASSDEVPLGREELERMNEEVVADIAEDLEEEEETSAGRANMAGRATGPSFDPSDHAGDDGPDVSPAQGLTGRKEEGDD